MITQNEHVHASSRELIRSGLAQLLTVEEGFVWDAKADYWVSYDEARQVRLHVRVPGSECWRVIRLGATLGGAIITRSHMRLLRRLAHQYDQIKSRQELEAFVRGF